jgi:hypothetical protein
VRLATTASGILRKPFPPFLQVPTVGQSGGGARSVREQWKDEIEWAIYDAQQPDWWEWFGKEPYWAQRRRWQRAV